jgi:protein transport protein SEC39
MIFQMLSLSYPPNTSCLQTSMAALSLSPAKVTLLAVQAAIRADIRTLRALLGTHPKTLHDTILRILLTYLPESLDSLEYVQLLVGYDSGNISTNDTAIDTSPLEGVSNAAASKKVRKLRLLSLRMEYAHHDAPEDPLILFLLHRAYRIDQQTGLIAQLPQLLAPFLDRSEYLRDWVLGTVLPLLRRNYEYHPEETETQSLEWFEGLSTVEAVEFLLSKTVRTNNVNELNDSTLARDLRCLAGPWLYGNNQWKRRKISLSAMGAQTIVPLKGAVPSRDSRYHDWDTVFAWIINKNSASYIAVSDAIEQWRGAADVDLGGYGDSKALLSQEDQRQINERYGHCALTASFLMPGESIPALSEAHRILCNVIARLKLPSISPLEAAAARLAPVPDFTDDGKPARGGIEELLSFLKNDEQEFSAPTQVVVDLLQVLIISSYLLLKSGTHMSIEKTGSMLHNKSESYQYTVLQTYLHNMGGSAGADDKLWVCARKEILWLHDWGKTPSMEGATTQRGRGVLGQIPRNTVEREILTALLFHGRKSPCMAFYMHDWLNLRN